MNIYSKLKVIYLLLVCLMYDAFFNVRTNTMLYLTLVLFGRIISTEQRGPNSRNRICFSCCTVPSRFPQSSFVLAGRKETVLKYKLSAIQRVLWDLNIPPAYLGAHYLAYAELLVLEDQSRLTMVTKWLYPEIAAYYHTSWQAVERNIRTVIAICWAQDGGVKLGNLMGCTFVRKPSPTRMIQALACYLLRMPDAFWQYESTTSTSSLS